MLSIFGLVLGSIYRQLEEKKTHHDALRELLGRLSQKGFYEVLLQIEQRGSMHYNEILRFAFEARLVASRASVTTILNTLTSQELLERTVLVDSRPIRTTYKISKKGKVILNLLSQLEKTVL